MNRRTFTSAVVSVVLAMSVWSSGALAHGAGHGTSGGPISQKQAELIAVDAVASFVEQEALDKTWSTAAATSSEKKVYGGREEWVVVVENPSESNPEKRSLFVFLTLDGEYIAANFTGE